MTDPKEVVQTFSRLAEQNRERGNTEAAGAYEDAANHVERELVDD